MLKLFEPRLPFITLDKLKEVSHIADATVILLFLFANNNSFAWVSIRIFSVFVVLEEVQKDQEPSKARQG